MAIFRSEWCFNTVYFLQFCPRGDCELVSVANFLPVNHMPDNKMKQTNMAEVCAHGHENTLGITSLHEADELAMDAGSWLHASKVQ